MNNPELRVVVDEEMLIRFGACEQEVKRFNEEFPNGFDISGLWGMQDDRIKTWREILTTDVLAENAAWAMGVGILPSRVIVTHGLRVHRRAALSGVDLSSLVADKISMVNAILEGADLQGAYFRYADFSDAYLRFARMGVADLSGSNLNNAQLNGAQMRETCLRGASLRSASVHNADLSYADLSWADMTSASLKGAVLNGANLSGATLDGVDMTGITWDEHTKWPDGFTPPGSLRQVEHE